MIFWLADLGHSEPIGVLALYLEPLKPTLALNHFLMSNSGRELVVMTVMVVAAMHSSLSESNLSSYLKISAVLADVIVSRVAMDSLEQHPVDLVVVAAVMPLSLVLDMIREWMEKMVAELVDDHGTSSGV